LPPGEFMAKIVKKGLKIFSIYESGYMEYLKYPTQIDEANLISL
jgi:hypothetical protein